MSDVGPVMNPRQAFFGRCIVENCEAHATLHADTMCLCHRCIQDAGTHPMFMVLCPRCGNKRCPHANDHRNACTNSNERGQPGSAYP